jgi:two-component system, cell cycle sensor histidine kinase and response regulator CckA
MKQKTVLVVDDSPHLLKMACRMLNDHGFRTLQATSGAEALTLAEDYSGEIHLLLSDVRMREMNGRELAKEIAKIKPSIVPLLMSGDDQAMLDRLGLPTIQKPFSDKELMERIHSLLGSLPKRAGMREFVLEQKVAV